jgi:spore germination cell wall hydrolase CwlJ-like protein
MPDDDHSWLLWDIALLALLGWREARSEPDAGIIAVMWTVRDRVEHPKWWGDSYSAVMGKKWQYSALAAPGDSQLILWPKWPDRQFTKCLRFADGVIHGTLPNPCPGADSYYATTIARPAWAKDEMVVGAIGAHVFFNVDGAHPENIESA